MRTRRPRSAAALGCLALLAMLAGRAGATLFETAESLMQEGRDLYIAGRHDEAMAKFERVLEKDPNCWSAYVYLARAHIARQVWPSAVGSARKASALAPGGQDVVPVFAEAL